jgi:AraC family transcriptional regulator
MRRATERSYHERILRVLTYIQEHLDEALALDDLAAVAHFSPYHFHRIFRGIVGESVMEHVRRLRLERAAHRLKFSDQPVTRIAFEAGYESHEAFTRAFGALFGAAPSKFRALRRWPAWPEAPSGIHYQPDGAVRGLNPFFPGGPSVDVRIETLPVLHVAFLRHVGPYEDVGQTWNRLASWAGPRGLFASHPRLVGIPYDDPEVTPADKLRYDACITVDDRVRPEGDVGIQDVGGGAFAVATHRGPFRRIGETFTRLYGEWLPTSGQELRGAPPLLMCRNASADTPEADLLTDIYMPLMARESAD